MERLAIYINDAVYQGRKAGISGIDLDFDKDDTRYIVSIKSGPKWGNSSQIEKLVDHFNTARKRLATSGSKLNIVCVNGCCYGKSREGSEYIAKGNYYKICGQRFWELVSGEADLYVKLIEPLSKDAKERNEEFMASYGKLVNRLTLQFLEEFSDKDGSIDWEKLVQFNSGSG